MANARYWLMKSEPTSFSIQDLRDAPKKDDLLGWVRIIKPETLCAPCSAAMKSSFTIAMPSSIVGIAEVVREGIRIKRHSNQKTRTTIQKAHKPSPWGHG